MADEPKVSKRRGRAMNLTLDWDAVTLLREMAPSGKGYGHLLSELVRAEVGRREERARVRKALETALASGVSTID